MKTSVVINRPMGLFNVEQRTKDGMFNATSFLRQWNEYNEVKKDLDDFLNNANTKEFIEALNCKRLDLIDTRRGNNGGTFIHPYLFVKFLIWLNPKAEIDIIKSVCDEFKDNNNNGFGRIFPSYTSLKTDNQKRHYKTYILLSNNGQCKIGRSINISKRIKQIATCNPNLIGAYIIDRDIENELHIKYINNNINGEWFSLSKFQLLYLKNKHDAEYVNF